MGPIAQQALDHRSDILRYTSRTLVDTLDVAGALRLRYRSGFDREIVYTPGAVERLEISLGHVAWRVLSGHRLRVQIQSANFPHLDANSNLGNPLGTGVAVAAATNKVFRDRLRASFIEFGVLG
jgi:predicted acyl esterase